MRRGTIRVTAAAAVAAAAVAAAAAAVVAPALPAAAATGTVFVSEIAPWSSGNSPVAADWFELTNGTASPITVTGWRMDDSSAAFATGVVLQGIATIAPGESVVYVESASATVAATFRNTWWGNAAAAPAGLQVGTYSGSGVGLGTGGDAVNVYDSTGALITGVTFGASTAPPALRTFDNAAGATGAITTLSTIGTNGAFAAGGPVAGSTETGSPGTATTSSGGPGPTTTTTTTTSVPPGPGYVAWPGGSAVSTVDPAATFSSNLSGLDHEGTSSPAPGVLWGVVNGPGTVHRLVFDGTNWVPDATNGWGAGKALRYPTGLGDPDAEGVTFVGGSSSVDGLYVATERDNTASSTSRLSVLRFDPSASGTTLTATNEWNLTADLPSTGANLGLEAITWIDDSHLVANNFFDDTKGHTYDPAEYPDHGTGLFLVGVEGTGMVHVYALKTDNTFARITSFAAGFAPATVMELQYDRDLHDLWAVCDNSCTGRMHVLRIDSTGHFAVALRYERPTGLPDTNDEGFAIAPASYCNAGMKPVFWSDDNDVGGFSLRTGTLPCVASVGEPPVQVPEFPAPALAVGIGLVLLAGGLVVQRRRPLGLAA